MRTIPVARFTVDFDRNELPRRADGLAPPGGEYAFLLVADLPRNVLAQAIDTARRIDVEPHEVLLSSGALKAQHYVEALAQHLGVGALRPGQPPLVPTEIIDGTNLGPGPLRALILERRAQRRHVALATPEVIDSLESGKIREARLKNAVAGLRRLDPQLSAAGPIRLWQLACLCAFVGLVIGGIAVAPAAARTALMFAVGLPFFLVVLFRVVVLFTIIGKWTAAIDARGRSPNNESELPTYTVMVPMFREQAVLPDLVEALSQIDYPAAKLDCMLVLEAADRETIAVARSMALPPFVRIVVVPDCLPRTKPKALNYAMQLARGEFVTVYDAEDVPDPQQLRKAVQAFAIGGPDVVCVQASLAIHNAGASWLTRGIMAQTPLEVNPVCT